MKSVQLRSFFGSEKFGPEKNSLFGHFSNSGKGNPKILSTVVLLLQFLTS